MTNVGELNSEAEPGTILVCFAVKEEAKFFPKLALAHARIETLVTGMGAENASLAIRAALETFSPTLVLTCGFAGGLNPKLPAGAIVFSEDPEVGLARHLVELSAALATFHCARRVAVTCTEKKQLWESTRADAVEMESGVIREICRAKQISSATIRVISDSASEDLPLDFNALMSADYEINFAKLLLRVASAPWKIPALLAFQRQTTAAARNLGEILDKLLRAKFDHR
ncbi:MAG: hypothetical protein HY043_19320 [Verrucomicrobia bacterium]|nr:hypothetical protein [Verrucomicrobiota bacterium]